MTGRYGVGFTGTLAGPSRTSAVQFNTGSVYGSIIPIGAGSRVVTGVPIWCSPFTNAFDGTPWNQTQGANLNQGIIVSFAVAFGYQLAPIAERQVVGFSRMWAGNSLVFDNSDDETIAKWPDINFTIHSGLAGQLPDELIAADKGDLTPGFRDLIYIVFKDFPVGKLIQPPLQVPTIRAKLVENTVFTNTVTSFAMIDEADILRGLGGVVDWKANRFWGWSYTGDDTVKRLHEYDMNTMQEVSVKDVNIAPHNWLGADWFMVHDEKSHIVHTMVDGIANTTPIAAFNLNSGALAGVFGVASTDLTSDSDGLQFSECGCVVRSIDYSGNDVSGVIFGGLFNDVSILSTGRTGSFQGYDYRGTTVEPGHPNCLFTFPIIDSNFKPEQWELDTQGQDFTVFAGIGDSLYAITGGARGGVVEIIDHMLIKSFPGYSVRGIIYDGSTGGFVCFLVDNITFDWFAARYRCVISSVLGVGTYHGFLPYLFSGASDAPFIPLSYWPFQTPGSCNPQYLVPIPDMNTGSDFRTAWQNSRTDLGTFGYKSGAPYQILDLATGNYRTLLDGVSPDFNVDWFWDSTRKLEVVTQAQSLTPDIPGIIRYERLDGVQPGFDLGDSLRWLALRAGYDASEIYVDPALTDPVLGVMIGEDHPAGPMFTSIGVVYDFQPFESEGTIKFIRAPRGTNVSVTYELNRDDLSPISEGDADSNEVLTTTYEEESGQYAAVSITYINPDMEYSYSTQAYSAQNTVTNSNVGFGVQDYKIPYVMTTAEAYARAGHVALEFNDLSVTQTFRLAWKYTRLEPTDVVAITIEAYRYIIRIGSITYNGDFSLSCDGRNYAYSNDVDIPSDGDLGTLPQTIPAVSDSLPVVLDIPLLAADYESERTVSYTAVISYGQTNWSGATFKRQPPAGTYVELFHSTHQLNMAIAQSALPVCGDFPFSTDTTTQLTLILRTMLTSAFASTDEDGLLSGLNALLIGDVDRWELVYFRDVTVIRPGVVTVSNLIRGQRGTESNTDNHAAGDTAYLIRSVATGFDYVLQPMLFAADLIGSTYSYKAEGDIVSTPAATVSQAVVGNSLKPWAPWGWQAVLSGSDVILTWQRRTRVSGELEDGTGTVPLDEAAELYELEILSGSTIVRTVTGLTASTFTYTAAMQAADGFTAPVASVKVRVYQISATVDRGFTHERTVNVE